MYILFEHKYIFIIIIIIIKGNDVRIFFLLRIIVDFYFILNADNTMDTAIQMHVLNAHKYIFILLLLLLWLLKAMM